MTPSAPSGTYAPAPGAAPTSAMLTASIGMETRLLLRNGEQLLLAVVVPLLVLVGGARAGTVIDLGAGRRIDQLAPGVMALAILSTAFTSLAITTGYERRYGVLKRLGASPLPRWGLLVAKIGSIVAVEVAQLLLIAGVAAALGWEPVLGTPGLLALLVLVLAGTAAFASLALLMAGLLRAEATLAAANLVFLLLVALGAVIVPAASYPAGAQGFVTALPSGALAEGLREALGSGSLAWSHPVVLVMWALVAGVLTARTFRWE